MPTKNQIGDLRWLVERDLRQELGVPPKTALNKDKIEFHKRQLALLDLAKQAPRCEHVFSDGRCCKAPRVKKGKLCYAHTLMEEKRPLELNLPPLEDANAVMLWLMDVLRGLAEGRISEKSAGLMFYGLQLAMVNARFTTFRDTNHAEMVRKAPKPQRADRRQRSSSPKSEPKALPQRAQSNTEEDEQPDPLDKLESEDQNRRSDVNAAKPEVSEIEPPRSGAESFTAPHNPEGIPGVESAKSIFFGVEAGEGVADNRPVSPPSEPPRKGSQREVPGIPEHIEQCSGR
jgi:hypothetical protein